VTAPTPWSVTADPTSLVLSPGQPLTVIVTVSGPAGQPATVVAAPSEGDPADRMQWLVLTRPTRVLGAASEQVRILVTAPTWTPSCSGSFVFSVTTPAEDLPTGSVVVSYGVVGIPVGGIVASIAVDTGPQQVALAPTGGRAYVCCVPRQKPGSVAVVDTVSNKQIATIPIHEAETWSAVAMGPAGHEAYVTTQQALHVIDTNTHNVVARIPLPSRGFPGDLAISPDGRSLYVVYNAGPSGQGPDCAIAFIDVAARTVASVLPLPHTGFHFPRVVASPDGTRLYVTAAPDALTAVDPTSSAVVSTIPWFTGVPAWAMDISADGTRIYLGTAARHPPAVHADVLVVIDPHQEATIATVALGGVLEAGTSRPYSILGGQSVRSAGSGTKVYVDHDRGELDVVDTDSEQMTRSLPLPTSVGGIALSRDGHTAYVGATDGNRLVVINLG
jgi:DNA-binding beta-propeller fold protein YncE